MAVAVAPPPIELDEPRIASESIEIPHQPPRWGPPLWPVEEPLAALARPTRTPLDAVALSIIVAHGHE